MEILFKMKTEKNSNKTPKKSFSYIPILIAFSIIVSITVLALRNYNFDIFYSNEKEEIAINAVNCNPYH